MYKRIVMVLVLLQITCVGAYGSQFTDTGGHWAEEIIVKWSDLGLISGYGDGEFKPENGITRAEFVTLINQAFGYKEEQKESFSDVLETDWHWKQVQRAIEVGYISGYEDKPSVQPTMYRGRKRRLFWSELWRIMFEKHLSFYIVTMM